MEETQEQVYRHAYNQKAREYLDLWTWVIGLGQRCGVWLAGDPDEAEMILTLKEAQAAIETALTLGERRNHECNLATSKLADLARAAREAVDAYDWRMRKGLASIGRSASLEALREALNHE